MEEIYDKLSANLHNKYELVWKYKLRNSPIRFKTNASKKFVNAANEAWLLALIDLTENDYQRLSKYIRICVPYDDCTVAISIFPTGTVLMQGKTAVKWAEKFMPQICKLVTQELNLLEETESLDGSLVTDKSVTVLGICVECDSLDNSEMIACDKENCNSWIHHKCTGLTEDEARDIYLFYCKSCRCKYNLEIQYEKPIIPNSPIEKTSTPILSSKYKALAYNSSDDSSLSELEGDVSDTSNEKSVPTSPETMTPKPAKGVINKLKSLTSSLFSSSGKTPKLKSKNSNQHHMMSATSLTDLTHKEKSEFSSLSLPTKNTTPVKQINSTARSSSSNQISSKNKKSVTDDHVDVATQWDVKRCSLIDSETQCNLLDSFHKINKNDVGTQCRERRRGVSTQTTNDSRESPVKINVAVQCVNAVKQARSTQTPDTKTGRQAKSTQTPDDEKAIEISNLRKNLDACDKLRCDLTLNLEVTQEKLHLAESLLKCNGNKPNQQKHRLEYRSYNELIKECLRQEEINDKLNTKVDELLQTKNTLKNNIINLKEEINNLETHLSARDEECLQQQPHFDLEVHIKSIRMELENEYKMRASIYEQLNHANNHILELENANHRLHQENMDLLFKTNHLQKINPWTTVDECSVNSHFSVLGQAAETDPNCSKLDPNRRTHDINGKSTWEEYNSLLRQKDLPYSMVVDNDVILLENNVTPKRKNPNAIHSHRTQNPNAVPNHQNPNAIPTNRNPLDLNLPNDRTRSEDHSHNAWKKVSHSHRKSVHKQKLSQRGPRPTCKWFLQGNCHSQYCIYDHPKDARTPAPQNSTNNLNNEVPPQRKLAHHNPSRSEPHYRTAPQQINSFLSQSITRPNPSSY